MAVVIYDFWVSFHPKSDKTNFHLISLVSGKRPIEKESGKKRGNRGDNAVGIVESTESTKISMVFGNTFMVSTSFFLEHL